MKRRKKNRELLKFLPANRTIPFAHFPNDNKSEFWAGSSAVSKQPSKARAHAIGTQRFLLFFQRPTDRRADGSGRPDRTPEAPFIDQFHSSLFVPLPIQKPLEIGNWQGSEGKFGRSSNKDPRNGIPNPKNSHGAGDDDDDDDMGTLAS